MMTALERCMPKHPEIAWTKPEGGLFLWLTLPKNIDTDELLKKAIEKKVAFVAGSGFYFDNPEHNAMRINFSYASHEQIDEGIKRLGETIEEALKG
jgi:DNA-binding transcriptional MocR family regulator